MEWDLNEIDKNADSRERKFPETLFGIRLNGSFSQSEFLFKFV